MENFSGFGKMENGSEMSPAEHNKRRGFEDAAEEIRRIHAREREKTGNEVTHNLDGIGCAAEFTELAICHAERYGDVIDFFLYIAQHDDISRRDANYGASKIFSDGELDRIMILWPGFTGESLSEDELEELEDFFIRWVKGSGRLDS